MRVSYSPGTWVALVQDGALLLLSTETDAALIAEIWERFGGFRDLGELVDLLTARSGGTFAGLPDFAAVIVEGTDARIAVRGAPSVVAETADGQERISGSDVTTWNERLLRGVTRVDAQIGGGSAVLPILGGVVHADRVSLEIVEGESAPLRAGHVAPVVTEPDAEPAVADVMVEPVAAPAGEPDLVPVDEPAPAPVAGPVAEPIGVVAPIVPPIVGIPPKPELPTVAMPAVPEPPVTEDESPIDTLFPTDTINPDDIPSSSEVDEFDMLWGDTIHRPPTVDAVAAELEGDHDGATISVAEARALRRNAPPVSPDAPTVALPVIGGARVLVSTGQVVNLDRTVIIGRRPRSTRASGANLPHLVAVESPQQDISRSHLEIRPEGDTILVTDLHTTNGSTLLRQGAEPVRLHPGEQTLVLSGDIIDLGDGVTVSFEDLP